MARAGFQTVLAGGSVMTPTTACLNPQFRVSKSKKNLDLLISAVFAERHVGTAA
jgi:hypothetical protein